MTRQTLPATDDLRYLQAGGAAFILVNSDGCRVPGTHWRRMAFDCQDPTCSEYTNLSIRSAAS